MAEVFQCRSSGLGITTLVSILLLGSVVFEGSIFAFNPLFCQFFWCSIILCSCQSSCFYYKSPHLLGSTRLQADSLPEMKHNASTEVTGAAVYLTPIFSKWSICWHDKGWSALACASSLTADVEKHFVLKEIWRCSQIFGAMLSLTVGGLGRAASLFPLNGGKAQVPSAPLMTEQRHLSCLPSSSLTTGNSWPWEPYIYAWPCKPKWPNAHGHGGPFLFICVACLGSALCLC